MSSFVIEHLPRAAAAYRVTPLDYEQAKLWLQQPNLISLVRTKEMIAAIGAGMGVRLIQSAMPLAIHPGDEALLITLAFGVLPAWAEGKMVPLEEDWRCTSLSVEAPGNMSNPS